MCVCSQVKVSGRARSQIVLSAFECCRRMDSLPSSVSEHSVRFLVELRTERHCPGWLMKYCKRALRAVKGFTEGDDGLDKGDVLRLAGYALDVGVIASRRLRSRTSKQLRSIQKPRIAEVLGKLKADQVAMYAARQYLEDFEIKAGAMMRRPSGAV